MFKRTNVLNIRPFPVTGFPNATYGNLRLGFLSPHNALDRRAFSGTAYFAARALEAVPGVTLRRLGDHQPPGLLARTLGRPTARTQLEDCNFRGLDAVVGLVATNLLDGMAKKHPDLPFLHVTDATPAFLRDVYGWSVPAEADVLERRVAAQATACLYSSQAMADRASADLGGALLETHVQPFGVNFDNLPKILPVKPPQHSLNLLFIGLDWVRKGGDVAVATLDQLRASGQAATLTVIGRCPEKLKKHPAIKSLGFLNKNRPGDALRLSRTLREAHLLLLPSRADCTPMVIAEAMAHGTPVIATDTGGIAGMIGQTGRVLPLHSPPALWAETVRNVMADRTGYDMLSDAAFERARAHLSWQSWAIGVVRTTQRALQHHTPRIAKRA